MPRRSDPKPEESAAQAIHRERAHILKERVEQTMEGWSLDIEHKDDLVAALVAAPSDCRVVTDKARIGDKGWATIIRVEYDKEQNLLELVFE